jgi:ribonuclease D
MQIPDFITSTDTLRQFCERAAHETFLTVDTEFMRERTYFPKLCLVQVGTSNDAVAIDPQAEGMDLEPLFALLKREDIVKVFHAARQDLEIFYQLMGTLPANLYDTQIAAMVCGYGESAGYERLVNDMLNETLDKASRFTDWAKRPLSERQIRYALDDVTHLRSIYTKLSEQIERENRTSWIAEEMAAMADPNNYAPDPQSAWKRLKVKSRKPEFLQMLRCVAAFREQRAIDKNLPRGRVLRDEVVLQVASENPETEDELLAVRGMKGTMSHYSITALTEQMHEARLAPKETFPSVPPRPKPLNAGGESCAEMLRMLLKQAAEEAHVVPRLITDRAEMEHVIRGTIPLQEARFMKGWRYEVFGKKAEAWLAGKLHVVGTRTKYGYNVEWKQLS